MQTHDSSCGDHLPWLCSCPGRLQKLLGPYFLLLDLLGILNVILAMRVLMHTGLKLWPTLGVIVGLLIGLRSFIESAVTRFLWSLRGFAP